MSNKRLWFTVCLLYLIFYMGDAFLCSYYSLYFLERGIPAQQQAILLALIPFSMFLGCLLFSVFASKGNRALWVFRFCVFVEMGLTIGYGFCDNFVSLAVLTPLIGLVNSAPFALIEGYIVPRIERINGNYAFVRIFGTIGYAVSLFLGAVLLNYVQIRDCFFYASGLFALTVACSFLLREKIPMGESRDASSPAPKKKSPPFSRLGLLFVLSHALVYGSFVGSLYLIPVHLNQLGFQDANYSLARGVGVVVETVFMLLIPLVAKLFKTKRAPMVLSGCFFIVSVSVGIFLTEPWSLAFIYFFINSVAKALLFSYQARMLQEVVGEELLGQTLTFAMGGVNLTSALLNLFSTTIFESWGYQGFFGLITGMEVAGVILLALLPRKKENPDSLEEANPVE